MKQFSKITTKNSNPRIVRYDELRPCYDAFIDTRTPGSDQKENFTIIGPGVSENPNQYVHIAEPHGFNIGGARQPQGCTNSQHSHDTVEVFYVHKGTWSFNLGEFGDDAKITLTPGDLIAIPTNVFRGFENTGEDLGYLWAVLGGDDPGRVLWAPNVFEMAKNYGLVLLSNGSLVDTSKGESVSDKASVMPVTTKKQVDDLDHYTVAELRSCCILSKDEVPSENQNGIFKRNMIGAHAQITRPHGFTISELRLEGGAELKEAASQKPDVVFVHEGELSIVVDGEIWELFAGDTATIPKGASRHFVNTGSAPTICVRVIGD